MVNAIDPLAGEPNGFQLRKIAKQRREKLEQETKQKLEEAAKLAEMKEKLKREKAKRKKKKEDELFNDILGMPKERKTKKKSEKQNDEKDFDFLDNALGANLAALLEPKEGEGDAAQDSRA